MLLAAAAAGPVVAGIGGRTAADSVAANAGPWIVRALRGRVLDPAAFLEARFQEAAWLLSAACVLLAAAALVHGWAQRRMAGGWSWAPGAAAGFAALNAWVALSSGAAVFWLVLLFGGPNLMQSAYHLERILLAESPAPVKAAILGASQGASEIHAGELSREFAPRVRFAQLSYAGTEAAELALLADRAEAGRPALRLDALVIYLSELNFYQGVSGSRFLPMMSAAGRARIDDEWLEFGVREKLLYAQLGRWLPLFQTRQAIEYFVYGFDAVNAPVRAPKFGEAPRNLVEKAERQAASYVEGPASRFQQRRFAAFVGEQLRRGRRVVLVEGQVHPILAERLPAETLAGFVRFIDELTRSYPEAVVLRRDELPRHAAEDYLPMDLMHIRPEARRRFTARLAELLERRAGWSRGAGAASESRGD